MSSGEPKEELYSGSKVNNKYSSFLKDKRIVLVGPARTHKGSKQKSTIDSYDVVVRINNGVNIPDKLKDDTGNRLDILYSSMNDCFFSSGTYSRKNILKYKKEYNLKWIVGTGHHRRNILKVAKYNKAQDTGVRVRLFSKSRYKKISSKLSYKPTTGIIVIYDLLKHDISELYITGFTFYNIMLSRDKRNRYYYPGYYPEYLKHAGGVYKHDIKGEGRMVKELCEKDKRIKVDKVLYSILKKFK
jgi:hypothetical protein